MRYAVPFATALGLAAAGFTQTQRLTDSQVKELMEVVEDDVERFTKSIDPKYRESTIRSATTEVSIESYTKDLKESAEKMRERFGSDYSASNEVLTFLRQAHGIEDRMSRGSSLFGAEKEWPRLSGSLGSLAAAYGVDWKASPETWAARRMNDGELEGAIASVVKGGESFKKGLDEALKKAPNVSKDERKAGLASAERLVKSAKDLKSAVSDGKDAAGALGLLNASVKDLRGFLEKHVLSGAVASTWAPVQSDLTKTLSAFHD